MEKKYYCNRCFNICKDDICENCGKKRLKTISDNDIVYLTTQNYFCSGLLDNILTNEQIRFLKKGKNGDGMSIKVGFAVETYDYYVVFSNLEKARKIIEAFIV